MRLIFFFGYFLFCGMQVFSWALDWKAVHEKADTLTVAEVTVQLGEEPRSEEVQYRASLVYLNAYQTEKALGLFRALLVAYPEHPGALWGQAEILRRTHQISESKKILDLLIKRYPDFSPPFISLAYIEYTQMNFTRALALCQAVIKHGRKLVDTSNLARAYLLLGGIRGMLAHYGGPIAKIANGTAVLSNIRKAAELQPNAAGVALGFGAFYLLAPPAAGGDVDKSFAYLERAIELDPFLVDAYVRLAHAYKTKGDDEKYQEYLQKALAIDPQNELARDTQSGACKFICIGGKG